MRRPLLFLLLLFAARYPAQGYGFRHFSVSDGLAQSMVTAVCEDSEGFLWFGTQEGLCRDDGYTFKTFRHEAGNKNSLADNYVLAIFEDSRSRLWIASRNGMSRYDRNTGQFVTITIRSDKPFGPRSYLVFSETPEKKIEACANGTLLTELNDSTLQLDPGKGELPSRFTGIPERAELPFADSSAGNQSPLFSLPGKMRVRAFFTGPGGTSWICTGRTLYRFDTNGKLSLSADLPAGSGSPAALLVDDQERTWVGCRNGLYIFSAGKWKKITAPGSPENETISALYQDKKGQLWIGTNFAGLFCYEPKSEVFAHAYSAGLTSKITWAFCEPAPGELWVGTAKGVNVLATPVSHATWTGILHDPVLTEDYRGGLQELDDKVITSFAVIHPNVWIGTSGSGVYGYNLEQNKLFAHFTSKGKDDPNFPADQVFCLAAGENGMVFAGTSAGIAMIDTRALTSQSIFPAKITAKKNSNYTMSLYTSGNLLFAGTSSGLFEYDLATGAFRSYTHDENDATSLQNNFVCCILPDPSVEGRFYLGTMGAGIVAFDRGKKTFRSYGAKDGLTGSTVYGILPDEQKRLWASTNDGIALLDPSTGIIEMFGPKDGIGYPEFSQNAWFKSRTGELLFGSTQGFVCFAPASVKLAENSPVVALTSLAINYQPVAPFSPNVQGSLAKPARIELWPGDRVLTVEYAGLNTGARPCTYKYRLAGFDEQWVVPANGLRLASYTNLPPGEYTLEISATQRADGSRATVYKIPVVVHPPFYSTWWFRLLAGITIAGIGIYTVRYFSQRRLREKLREMQTQKRIQEERERISRDLHDNVGAQLTYIIATLDNVSWKMRRPGNETESQQKLERLGEQARSTMQQLRESIWAINSTSVTVEELARKTQEFMQQLAENYEHVRWEVKSEGALTIKPSAAVQLFRIVQESVSNAFRHSGGTEIVVSFTAEDEQLQVAVTDNGRGFDTSVEHTGHYGLKNMPVRAQQLGAEFRIRSEKEKGTTVELILTKLEVPQ